MKATRVIREIAGTQWGGVAVRSEKEMKSGGAEQGPEPCETLAEREAEARSHIASVAEGQRGARGTIEHVTMPWIRKHGRRLHQVWTWIAKIAGNIWRRIADPHKRPGRWGRRILLWRVTETFSRWVVIWTVVVIACAVFAFRESTDDPLDWLSKWALAGSLAALLAVVWRDFVTSPHTVRRVRRRIVAEPEALLRPTLARPATQIVQLDPPVDTVPRGELYDELLPGALARKKDVQIIVGDPGAGKTTALVDLASVLAKTGLVPVMLELRGESTSQELVDLAHKRFEEQVRPFVKTSADADIVWRWLCRRQRLAVLVDDIDQIGSDGEPGFAMRRLLENIATEGLPVIVTARPAGVPAGIAASAITIEPLDFETAVDLAARPSSREPGATTSGLPPRGEIERWVEEGDLTDAPLYLEALAELTSVGACPNLPEDPKQWGSTARPGRWRKLSASKREWRSLWTRYMLLERFYEGIVENRVRRSLAIDSSDRRRSINALEGAALGALGATGREAAVTAAHADDPREADRQRPKRSKLVEFIDTNDRRGLGGPGADGQPPERRSDVSQHEAIDTCERLRILSPDWRGDPQFRHRIMQAFLAGRSLAKLGRLEQEKGRLRTTAGDATEGPLDSFDAWVTALMDRRHPEKLTAQLALTFAAIHADEKALKEGQRAWDGLAAWILRRLVEAVEDSVAKAESGSKGKRQKLSARLERLDPTKAPDPHKRTDPDDDLIKLTTAANLAALLRHPEEQDTACKEDTTCKGKEPDNPIEHSGKITELVCSTEAAMRWTKLQAVPAIAGLGGVDAWRTLWEHFTRDRDYDVRRAAGKQLEKHAWNAYPKLQQPIERHILHAGQRAARGKALKPTDKNSGWSRESFVALGWVLPAIVSGLGEELRVGEEAGGTNATGPDSHESYLDRAREQLGRFATLAYEGCRPELEDSLAQGFKADAMRHASDPAKTFKGPGWVASNRRLVADIALPHAESWYARMLLYQALALYAISGTNKDDTLDILSHRLHRTRERHPLARRAAKLARTSLRHAQLKGPRWEAFIWSDDVEDAGRLPSVLARGTAQLVGDVAVLVDLKEGSPPDRHESFGHMEELPYCLSHSKNRHEILGSGCPPHCGWGFCPYRAASPDEPNAHRGLSRGFCRGERRLVKPGTRSPAWQRKVRGRRMREFWEQMEFKARR
jgi:NACHT domain